MKDKHKPVTGWRRITPRYWPTWLIVGLLRLVIKLPYRVQLGIGRTLGKLFRRFSPYRRTITRTNLELCFPELDTHERLQLEKRCYESLGCSIIETAAGLWAPDNFFADLHSIAGLEHIETARRQGKGVLLLSGHFCSVDFAGRVLLRHVPAVFTYQEFRNRVFDSIVQAARAPKCKALIHRHDLRGFIRALQAGDIVWYAPDQDQGARNSVFAPLFGIPAQTLTATTRLAKMTGAAVLPFLVQRLPDARGYTLTIQPALEHFPGKNEVADATRFNALIESQIRQNPGQYLWIHRRFKARPGNEPKLYPPKPRRVKRLQRAQRQATKK